MNRPVRRVVLIPTYNERRNVSELVERIAGIELDVDVTFIDDNSPDGTAKQVQTVAERYPQVRLLNRPAKEGLGRAYQTGLRWALEQGYDQIAQMDGDLSHEPEALPRFFALLDEADLVIGSRYVRDGSVENWNAVRRTISQTGNLYVRAMLSLSLTDATSGFRAYRRPVVENYLSSPNLARGFAYQIEFAWRAMRAGFVCRETPICFHERSKGKTKINLWIIWEAIWVALLLRLTSGGGRTAEPRPLPSGKDE